MFVTIQQTNYVTFINVTITFVIAVVFMFEDGKGMANTRILLQVRPPTNIFRKERLTVKWWKH